MVARRHSQVLVSWNLETGSLHATGHYPGGRRSQMMQERADDCRSKKGWGPRAPRRLGVAAEQPHGPVGDGMGTARGDFLLTQLSQHNRK